MVNRLIVATFSFKAHLQKLDLTTDEVEKMLLKKELFDYYDALSKDEQKQFKEHLNRFLRQESIRIRKELEEIKNSIS
jgi:exonuclease I